MSDKCKKMLGGCNAWTRPHQCYNNVKKDGYCGIHHPDAVKARQEKTNKRWKEKLDNSGYGKLKKALATVDTLTARIAELTAAIEAHKRVSHGDAAYLGNPDVASDLRLWAILPTPPKEAE